MKADQIALEAIALQADVNNLRKKASVSVSNPKFPSRCKEIALFDYAEKLKEILDLFKSYLELVKKDCTDIEQSLQKLQDADKYIADTLGQMKTGKPQYANNFYVNAPSVANNVKNIKNSKNTNNFTPRVSIDIADDNLK